MTFSMDRISEQAKYPAAYRHDNYRMGQARFRDAMNDLGSLPCRGSYLDVGCGRREMLRYALSAGFHPVSGTEVVPDLIDGEIVVRAEAHDLPFGDRSFDVVSLFDVIEHLVSGDDWAACQEIRRVAKRHILLTANNKPSPLDGVELHINRRPYEQWDALFRDWFAGATVTRLEGQRFSETWRVDL